MKMTLLAAIEMLQFLLLSKDINLDPDFHPAVKLGIEALKRVRSLRQYEETIIFYPLKGETREEEEGA
jgi:hypothetical protein